MPALSAALAVGGLVAGGVGAAKQAKAAKKAAKAQNEANDIQRKQNDLAAMRQKRDAIRQARLATAAATNAAASQGVADSSSAQGGIGSIQTQLGGELSFLDTWNAYSDQASKALGRANHYEYKAKAAASLSNLGMTVFNNSDIIADKVSGVFKSG